MQPTWSDGCCHILWNFCYWRMPGSSQGIRLGVHWASWAASTAPSELTVKLLTPWLDQDRKTDVLRLLSDCLLCCKYLVRFITLIHHTVTGTGSCRRGTCRIYSYIITSCSKNRCGRASVQFRLILIRICWNNYAQQWWIWGWIDHKYGIHEHWSLHLGCQESFATFHDSCSSTTSLHDQIAANPPRLGINWGCYWALFGCRIETYGLQTRANAQEFLHARPGGAGDFLFTQRLTYFCNQERYSS